MFYGQGADVAIQVGFGGKKTHKCWLNSLMVEAFHLD
jgi:hypothetical protein